MERTWKADRIEELLAHRAWVRRVARALVLDESRAADLEQEAWLQALQGAEVRSPKAWLGTVLRNAASNLRRGEARRRLHEASVPQAPPPPSPADLLERAEVVERVARAVREMEEPHQTVVLLRYFEDLSPPEIADRLGVPVETVRTRLKRALVLLRGRLDAQEGGGRRRWMLLLLPLARQSVPRPSEAAAGGSALAAVAGVLAMGTKTKVAVGAALLLLLGGGAWILHAGPEQSANVQPRGHEPAPTAGGSLEVRPVATGSGSPAAGSAIPSTGPERIFVPGIVRGPSGQAFPGAEVFLSPGAQGATDAEGRFRLEGRRPADVPFRVIVRARGYESVERDVPLAPGSEQAEQEFTLVPDLVVAGRVEDDGGAPVAGAGVFLLLPGSGRNESLGTTDVDGRFSVTRGETGAFLLRVDAPEPPERWRSSIYSTVVRSGDREVVVILRRRPEGRARLRAEVVDGATGAACTPTRALIVEATSGMRAPRGVPATVVPGLVTCDGLWPGIWRIWLEVPGRAPAMQKFYVGEGDTEIDVRVETAAMGTLSGRVEFGDGPTREMIYVHAVGRLAYSGGLPSWLPQSSVVGQFPFGSVGRDFEFSLMPGEYVVEASAKDSGPGPITETSRKVVHVGPGERVKVELRLGPVAQIDFRGGLVPGLVAELWMAEGDGPFELRDKLTGGGHLRMVQTVTPGTYRWRMRFLADDVEHAALPAAETLEGIVTVAAGAKVEVPVPAVPRR